MSRLADLQRLYSLLDQRRQQVGGTQTLGNLGIIRTWTRRGVYFFFEPGEDRCDSGEGPRVVRVGTHALSVGSKSTLRQRLGQHRGSMTGGGNHRGSIFRLLVGQALLARGDELPCSSWGLMSDIGKASGVLGIERAVLASAEQPVERAASRYLAVMPCLWLDVDDEPGPKSLRALIECNAIALLSNYGRAAIDPPSPSWLGRFSDRPLVSGSGLWNQRHVKAEHDRTFLSVLEEMINNVGRDYGRVS